MQGEVGEHGQKGGKGGKGEHVSDTDLQQALRCISGWKSFVWITAVLWFCSLFVCLFVGRVLLVHPGQWVLSVSLVLLWVQNVILWRQNRQFAVPVGCTCSSLYTNVLYCIWCGFSLLLRKGGRQTQSYSIYYKHWGYEIHKQGRIFPRQPLLCCSF